MVSWTICRRHAMPYAHLTVNHSLQRRLLSNRSHGICWLETFDFDLLIRIDWDTWNLFNSDRECDFVITSNQHWQSEAFGTKDLWDSHIFSSLYLSSEQQQYLRIDIVAVYCKKSLEVTLEFLYAMNAVCYYYNSIWEMTCCRHTTSIKFRSIHLCTKDVCM